jgi:hypothetical protein
MGSYVMGRGQYTRWNAKISTTNLHFLRLAEFKKHKCLAPGQWHEWYWSRDGKKTASVRFTVTDNAIRFIYAFRDGGDNQIDVDRTILLTLTPCNFGGFRKWFRCGCARKVATMYIHGQEIACRHCFNAVYPSQREDAVDRKWRKICKLEDRLNKIGDDPIQMVDDRHRPKGMHRRTFARIKHEWMTTNIKRYELIDLEYSRCLSWKIE